AGEVGEGWVPPAAANTDGVSPALTSDEVRSQIEQTRAEMSGTIDAIQSRLSPKRVLADAKDSVKEATVGRVKRFTQLANNSGDGMLQRVQANPLPVALLAMAAAGLLLRTLMNAKRPQRDGTIATKPVQHEHVERMSSAN